jgi:Carboxypeptidase regulatory-like domain
MPYLGVMYAITQTILAPLTGAVSDPSGAAVPGASAVVGKLQSSCSGGAATNSAGFCQVLGLLPGYHRLTVAQVGFKTVVRDCIELRGQDEVANLGRLFLVKLRVF